MKRMAILALIPIFSVGCHMAASTSSPDGGREGRGNQSGSARRIGIRRGDRLRWQRRDRRDAKLHNAS